MMHVIIGLFFIALGVWGVFDERYYVVDFIKGGGSVFLIIVGALAIFAGVASPLEEDEPLAPVDEDLRPLGGDGEDDDADGEDD